MKHRTAAGGARASVPRVAGASTGALVARRVRVAREVIKRNECTIRVSSTPGIVYRKVLINVCMTKTSLTPNISYLRNTSGQPRTWVLVSRTAAFNVAAVIFTPPKLSR